MALVPEDGTGKSDADTYQLPADVKTYAENIGKTFDDQASGAEAWCRLATIRLDQDYEAEFMTFRMTSTQALAFPRGWFYDRKWRLVESGTMPKALTDAHAELVLRAAAGDDLFPDTTNRLLLSETHQTEAYAHTQRFASAAADTEGAPLKRYPAIDKLISVLLRRRTTRRM